MQTGLRFTILGCGSSGGVPRLGNHWGECDPENPRNSRLRCSMLVERIGPNGTTRALIDTTPDMRAQLLKAGIGVLDAVVFTHAHADHTHGLDDLRQIVFNTRRRLPVWADGPTQDSLYARFAYAFDQPEGSAYPPICDMHAIRGAFQIEGAGGPIPFLPLKVAHGGIDALRRTPHPTHAHLALALEWIERAAPARAVLTNMHIDLDHDRVAAETPAHVIPAHDGMVIELAEPRDLPRTTASRQAPATRGPSKRPQKRKWTP